MLVAAGVANVLIFLDQTASVVALPAIQRDFHCTTVEVQWTIGVYLLVLAALAAGSGRIADLYGRRRLFIIGIAVFGLASVACAAAPSVSFLIAARAVQGAGAALTAPLIVAHATGIVPAERRAWAIGVVASAGTSFLVLGPLIGGLLVDTVGWRWVFLINVPVVILSVALAARFMPESRSPDPPRLDIPGLVLLTVAFGAIVSALLHLHSWDIGVVIAAFAAGACALVAFVAVERRSSHPLLALALLRNPRVIVALTALIAIQGSVLGVTVYVVLFLQNGLGLGGITAGLVLILAGMWTPLLSRMTGRMVDRTGSRTPISRCLLVATVGLLAIGLEAQGHTVLALIPGLFVFGLSRPFVFTPASAAPNAQHPR